MNSVDRVLEICKERKIAISKIEKDLGFGNGYIRGLKNKKLPDDRLSAIAKYLNVSLKYLVGEEAEFFYSLETSKKMCEAVATKFFGNPELVKQMIVPREVRDAILKREYQFSSVSYPQFGILIGMSEDDFGIKKEPAVITNSELMDMISNAGSLSEKKRLFIKRILSIPDDQFDLLIQTASETGE